MKPTDEYRDLHGRTISLADRDDLKALIETKFRTRRAICKATGLSEDMLIHVLNGRKHLSIEVLTAALGRVGYTLHITSIAQRETVGS